MKKICIAALLLMFYCSCERDLKIDIPRHESRLVINAEWSPGNLFEARITRSRGISESVSPNEVSLLVVNALVLVKENGVVIDTLKYNQRQASYISSNKRAAHSKVYEIEVSTPGFPAASGIVSSVPSPVRPISVLLQRAARTVDNELQSRITITFRDSVARNFYVFRLMRYQDILGPVSFPQDICIQTFDRDIERVINTDPLDFTTCYKSSELLVADKNFNGTEKSISFFIRDDLMNPYDDGQIIVKPWLQMLHVNEDYFRYLKALSNYNRTRSSQFSEPVNVPNNIKNGYGFFTVYSMAVDTLQ